jgi:hypothetical protein
MNSPAIKVIVTLGILAFAILGLTSVALKNAARSGGSRLAVVEQSHSPFDSKRAYADLKTIVAFGPRTSGSQALERSREFIKQQLGKAGLKVWEHAFDAPTPVGTLKMVNVVGVIEGTKPGIIVLGNHYETKYFSDIVFVGANDGGSTTAWMIEMGRTLGPRRDGRTVWLGFFDGEESFGEWSATDGLYGSRAFVEYLRGDGRLAEIQVMINLDMIGDCYLGIKRDRAAPEWLTGAIWGAARTLNYAAYFLPFADAIEDDHVPFRRAGIPAVDIIDFSYGRLQSDHVRLWHTANDTIDHVCAESLQVVGDVIYHALPKVDAYLDSSGRG